MMYAVVVFMCLRLNAKDTFMHVFFMLHCTKRMLLLLLLPFMPLLVHLLLRLLLPRLRQQLQLQHQLELLHCINGSHARQPSC